MRSGFVWFSISLSFKSKNFFFQKLLVLLFDLFNVGWAVQTALVEMQRTLSEKAPFLRNG